MAVKTLSLTTSAVTELPDELKSWPIGNTVNILIAGRTGVGKSSLVNSLVGAKEGHNMQAETMEVTKYAATINGISVIIWDSSGFEDASGNEKRNIKDMKKKVRNIRSHSLLLAYERCSLPYFW